MLIVGITSIVLGIILFVYAQRNYLKPITQRPNIFDKQIFSNILFFLWIILLVTGLAIVIISNLFFGFGIVLILIIYALITRFSGTDYSIIKTNYDIYFKIKEKFPNQEEEYYLKLLAKSRYPKKTESEIFDILNDCSNIDSLIMYILFVDKPHYRNMDNNQIMDFYEKFSTIKNKIFLKMGKKV